VLVHCAGGVSRSATVVLGYLMSRRGLTFDQSLTELRRARPWVNPNAGFVLQLREWERLGKDAAKWRPWAEVWAAAVAGGAGAEPGDNHSFVLSIPPPANAGAGAAGGAGGRGGGLGAELLGFARLRVDGGAARRSSQEQQQRQQQQGQPPEPQPPGAPP
jgi:hypothetical protein